MSRFLGTNTLVVAIVLMSTLSAHAALVFWDNDSTDHDFTNAVNWGGDLYPLPEDYAVIQNNSYANISSAADTISRVYVGADQGVASDPPLAKGTGTLNVLAGGSLTTGSTWYIGEGDNNQGIVNVTGGSLTTGAFGLGYGSGSTGTLNVSAGGAYSTGGYLYVGRNAGAFGVVNLSDGTVSGTLDVRVGYEAGANGTINQSGGTFTAAASVRLGMAASSVGVYNQTGGTLTLNTTSGTVYAGSGEGAYGYYRLAAGTFTGAGFGPGGTGAVGVIEQEAGSVMNVGRYGIRTGVSSTGVALFNQKGGTVNLDRVLWAGGQYSGTWGQIELGGTTTIVPEVEYTAVGRHAGSFGYLNLNATGTLTTPNVRFYATVEGGGQGVFAFLGGTLKPNASTPDPADPATHFMRREGAATGDISIVIGAQGGTIDTDGYDIVISEPLQGMTDYGVSSITLMDGGNGYQGTPVVRITGGSGKGATALATVSGGVVTGITITNPGTGYAMADSLNVEILGGGGSPATVLDSSLALNAADGGLTKQGLGTLTLAGANTYTGLTSVQAGALNLTGSLVGDVDVETGAALMGNGGTVGGDVDLDGTLAVAYNGDDDTINLLNIVGELDLTGATFSFSNLGAGALAEGEYVFATYGSLIGGPAVHVGLQSGWSVDYTYEGNSIALLVTGGDPIPGDANNSGTVDEADAKLMAANWGASGEGIGWAQGDFDGNGIVNAADAAILAAHWGMSGGSGAPETAGAPVPEPSVLIAILGGLLSLAWIRRKR